MTESSTLLEQARAASSNENFKEAESKYQEIILSKESSGQPTSKVLQDQEAAILELGKIYQNQKQPDKLNELLAYSRAVLGNFAKSKTAKIVKTLIEYFDNISDALELQIQATKR